MTGEYAGAVSAAETAGGAQPCTQGALRAAEGAREAAGRRGETPGAAAAQADGLAARQYAYLLFQRLFGAEPSGELFSAIDVAVARDAFDIACGAADGEPSFRELLGVLESAAGADAGGLDAWKAEYTRLFVGPAALPAPPWESVYTSHGRLVMQPSTLEVRSAYHKCGFEPALCRRVPDDHVALELDFMAALAKEALEARQRADAKGARDALAASAQFLQEHLGVWVQEFADALRGKGRAPRYAPVACALAAFVASDAARLAGAGGKV